MEQEKIDQFNREAIKILGYEKAPDNFTAILMDKIQIETVHTPGLQKPIIGKWGWLVIIVAGVLLIIGMGLTTGSQGNGNNLIAYNFINDWWTRYIHPLLNSFLIHASQFGVIALIGITATFMLFADSLIGSKIKSRITFN